MRPVQLGGLICLFSTEVDSAKFPNGATHWASVRTEVCACPEMVYGTLRQSEGVVLPVADIGKCHSNHGAN